MFYTFLLPRKKIKEHRLTHQQSLWLPNNPHQALSTCITHRPPPGNDPTSSNHPTHKFNRYEPEILKLQKPPPRKMCFIIHSTCPTPSCGQILWLRYSLCNHAAIHSMDPLSCPNHMKRRRINDRIACGKCDARRGSLSLLPGGEMIKRKRNADCVAEGEGEGEGEDSDSDNDGTMVIVSSVDSPQTTKPPAQPR
jgi:hypothetical protein